MEIVHRYALEHREVQRVLAHLVMCWMVIIWHAVVSTIVITVSADSNTWTFIPIIFQTSMSVQLAMEIVPNYVPIPMEVTFALVYLDSCWMLMAKFVLASYFVLLDEKKAINYHIIHPPIDINECALNNGNCSQTCTNKNGTYMCSCTNGYLLNPDNRTCSGE